MGRQFLPRDSKMSRKALWELRFLGCQVCILEGPKTSTLNLIPCLDLKPVIISFAGKEIGREWVRILRDALSWHGRRPVLDLHTGAVCATGGRGQSLLCQRSMCVIPMLVSCACLYFTPLCIMYVDRGTLHTFRVFACIYIYICCEVIIWAKFRVFQSY